jgi:hypothetical protein
MNPTIDTIVTYLLRVTPGFALGALMLFLARRDAAVRIVIYLALFILSRHAMTPLGLWFFGAEGLFWIRLSSDPVFMVVSGLICLTLSMGLSYLDRENRALFQWTRGRLFPGLVSGVLGALVVVAPLAAAYQYTPIESRGDESRSRMSQRSLFSPSWGTCWKRPCSAATTTAGWPARCLRSGPVSLPASSLLFATSTRPPP